MSKQTLTCGECNNTFISTHHSTYLCPKCKKTVNLSIIKVLLFTFVISFIPFLIKESTFTIDTYIPYFGSFFIFTAILYAIVIHLKDKLNEQPKSLPHLYHRLSLSDWILIIEQDITRNGRSLFTSMRQIYATYIAIGISIYFYSKSKLSIEYLENYPHLIIFTLVIFVLYSSHIAYTYGDKPRMRKECLNKIKCKIIYGEIKTPNEIRELYLKCFEKDLPNTYQNIYQKIYKVILRLKTFLTCNVKIPKTI